MRLVVFNLNLPYVKGLELGQHLEGFVGLFA